MKYFDFLSRRLGVSAIVCKTAAFGLFLGIILCGCNTGNVEDWVATAIGEYDYTAKYYSSESDVLVRHYYASKQDEKEGHVTTDEKPAERTNDGTLTVKGVEGNTKIIVALDNGLSFTTSKVYYDVLINPSNCFDFTVPVQQTAKGEVVSFNFSENPDGDLSQGSYYGYENEEELEFGLKLTEGREVWFVHFYAEKK